MLYSIEFVNGIKGKYEVYPQIKLIDKFNTELDVFEFTLKPISNKLDLDFKKYNGLIPIVLKANGEEFRIMYLTYYKCVNTQHNPKNYKYMFQTVSPTFKLQRNTLPNKLITQPITDNKRTVWEELNKIMEVYADDITINPDLQDLMNIACPELQFVKSTLHEILITLFGVCGLAPKMDYYYYLSYIDLKSSTNVNNWKSEEIFIREEETNNVQNYADSLDFDIENAISNDEDITTQWLSPTSENAIVGTDDFIWKVPSNIYEIVKVELFGSMTASKDDVLYILNTVDITDYVIPKSIYDTKYVSSKIFEDSLDYKRNLMYYENNIIGGGAFTEDAWLNIGVKPAIQNVIRKGLFAMGYSYDPTSSASETDYRNFLMKVTYKTQANGIRVKIVKNGVDKPINNMISNQEESFIDTNNFGKQKQELINRMGNELLTGQARFDLSKINYLSELNIANLGDRVDNDYIITEREMQFNENTLLINYKVAKYYIFLTGYSGLNQVKRFTSIDTQNTLIRNDNFLYNYKIELENKNNNDYLVNTLINNYGKFSENGLMLHYVKTFDSEINALQDYYILVNSQNKVVADSVIVNFKFETNVKVGDSIVKDGLTYLKEPIMYTDNNGEFRYLDLYFGAGEEQRDITDLEIVRKYPKVENASSNLESATYLINKDNREITSINLQFRFVGDNKNVFVYDDFVRYTQITAHKQANFKFYAQYFEDEEEYKNNLYKQTTNKPIGNEVFGAISFVNNTIKITGITTEFGYWVVGVCDENNNLLLGINHTQLSAISTIELYVNKII